MRNINLIQVQESCNTTAKENGQEMRYHNHNKTKNKFIVLKSNK